MVLNACKAGALRKGSDSGSEHKKGGAFNIYNTPVTCNRLMSLKISGYISIKGILD